MPSNRQRRTRAPEPKVSANVRAYLLTGDHDKGGFEVFRLWGDAKALRTTWVIVEAELLPEWIRQHPCTRPAAWWELDAPQEPIPSWPGEVAAQRRRIGGIGTPEHEVLNVGPEFAFGLPVSWTDQREADFYNGRSRDIHGVPTNQRWPPGSGTYKEGDFAGVAIDPADPPTFESEAAYLARHGLLTPAERKHLAAHPALLEPEPVVLDADDADGGEAP